MKIYNHLFIIIGLLTIFSCQKDLSITEFSDDFSNYEPELRIEALILPTEKTALVRVDKSILITDIYIYDCIDNDYGRTTEQECIDLEGFWHGDADSTIANCGDWNPLIHDVGIDGEIGDGKDDDGDCSDCSVTDALCQESCRDEDSIGENNGVPDCNEPNVDGYNEILPNIHENRCIVSMTKINNDGLEEICEFIFDPSAGEFFDIRYNGGKGAALVDDFYTVNYGAYVPNENCSATMWANEDGSADTESEYRFNADCSAAGFGTITSKEPITVSDPVVFVDIIQNSTFENPETQSEVAEYLESLGINDCIDYVCLEEKRLDDDLVYFPRYSQFASILWATISPNVYFEATEYMYDSTYFHGHPSVGTDFFNIVNDVCLMSEAIFSDYYDGYGNGEWDNDTDDEDAEIFADENGNGQYDDGEFFIDRGDNIGDIDTYYYKISTFSESYKNYYYYSQLLPNDPERSNLRDENMNPIMGAFGSITTNRIDFQIIDCLEFLLDEDSCNDPIKTHGVCTWHPNVVFPEDDYSGPACLPINWTF